MDHMHHESNHLTLLQHKSIYLDEQRHVALTLLCRAELHVEPDHVAAFLVGALATSVYHVLCR
jgi:hypothetical protein